MTTITKQTSSSIYSPLKAPKRHKNIKRVAKPEITRNTIESIRKKVGTVEISSFLV